MYAFVLNYFSSCSVLSCKRVRGSGFLVGDERNLSPTPVAEKRVFTLLDCPMVQRVIVVVPPSSGVIKIFGV